MNPQHSDEDEAPTPPLAPIPPLQRQPPPAQVRAPLHPQQPAVVSNLAMDQVLMLLSEAFFMCEELGLQAKRALACTCSTLRPVIFPLLRQPKLVVRESDAIWDNARFVANVLVPNVPDQILCVAGETCLPEMKLAHLRTLPKLKVGAMGPTAALFFGAAIAESDCMLRLSTGATKSLRALRENGRVSLPLSDVSQPSDRNAMFGALTLNSSEHVTVLDDLGDLDIFPRPVDETATEFELALSTARSRRRDAQQRTLDEEMRLICSMSSMELDGVDDGRLVDMSFRRRA